MIDRCENCDDGNRFIKPWGNESSSVAIVGIQPSEAHPDDSECAFALDIDRRQRSSEILQEVFDELGLEFEDYYWTNVFKCPAMTGDQKVACTSNTYHELRPFHKVIALGSKAYSNVPKGQYDVERIWHPAYVLRNRFKMDDYVDQWDKALGASDSQAGLEAFG